MHLNQHKNTIHLTCLSFKSRIKNLKNCDGLTGTRARSSASGPSATASAPPVAVLSFGGPKVGIWATPRSWRQGQRPAHRERRRHGQQGARGGAAAAAQEGVVPARRRGTPDRQQELAVPSPGRGGPPAGTTWRMGRPFRHDARRSVIRLLQMQRGNVKKEYVNRARELGVDPAAPADVGRSMVYGSCAVASPSS